MEKRETQDLTKNQNKDLEDIRYFKGDWKTFFDYWKYRGVKADPYKGTKLIYPKVKTQEKSELPIQDFGTYAKSEMNRVIESYEEFITNTENKREA
jgi:hypothetical protein